jgi:murein DD-endopeptidase MepM/ murein hydrolase activator NlpD
LPTPWRVSCALALLSLPFPTAAVAHDPSGGTGGASAPDEPQLEQAVCEDSAVWECSPGAKLTLEGESLSDVREVRFVGRRGRQDDRVVRPAQRNAHEVDVRVPYAARSGPIAVQSAAGHRTRSAERLRVRRQAAPVTTAEAAPLAATPGEGVFPIAGPHDYGTATNRFGGGRGHGGQDVFAKCGTPLVAVFDATVQHVATHSRAGNYVVLQAFDGQSYAYMHLQSRALVRKGQSVVAGQQVGKVGDTGHATGCHLHFEQWTAPGWYEGGEPIDPLPLLRELDG